MIATDAAQTIGEALLKSNLSKDQMPNLLSDNGNSYVAFDFKKYLEKQKIKSIHGRPGYSQTQGKIERYHCSIKRDQTRRYSPLELEHALKSFVKYYKHQRYHKSVQTELRSICNLAGLTGF